MRSWLRTTYSAEIGGHGLLPSGLGASVSGFGGSCFATSGLGASGFASGFGASGFTSGVDVDVDGDEAGAGGAAGAAGAAATAATAGFGGLGISCIAINFVAS